MNQRFATILTALALVLFSLSAAMAQHNHSGASVTTGTPAAQTDDGDAMQQCQKHHSEGLAALDKAASSLARAKQLSDPNELKAAIDSADKRIAEARLHLGMCPMAQGRNMDHSGTGSSEHQGHKMKCMSRASQSYQ